MFVATLAFIMQSALVLVSKVEAASGLMSEPAVTLSGSLHYHDHLAGHVHDHDDHDEGHVHDAPVPDDDPDKANCASICSLFASSMSFATASALVAPRHVSVRGELTPFPERPGVDPAALIRPPSTPSIA